MKFRLIAVALLAGTILFTGCITPRALCSLVEPQEMTFKTSPSGAMLYIDGVPQGKTPLKVVVHPRPTNGTVILRNEPVLLLKHDGYADTILDINIEIEGKYALQEIEVPLLLPDESEMAFYEGRVILRNADEDVLVKQMMLKMQIYTTLGFSKKIPVTLFENSSLCRKFRFDLDETGKIQNIEVIQNPKIRIPFLLPEEEKTLPEKLKKLKETFIALPEVRSILPTTTILSLY